METTTHRLFKPTVPLTRCTFAEGYLCNIKLGLNAACRCGAGPAFIVVLVCCSVEKKSGPEPNGEALVEEAGATLAEIDAGVYRVL